jgi:UDP-N-acetylglucosamine 1-carboxyvinyltransferase
VGGLLCLEAKDGLKGTAVYLDIPSVGATINIMMAAVFADGQTVIENAAKEPHVVDAASFLNMLGANIKGAGTDFVRINGVKTLHGATYTIIPDQIEAGTYMIAAAATGGDVKINNVIPKHMDSLSAKLSEMDCTIMQDDDSIRVIADRPLKAVNVKAMYYPGLPTDLQPQMAALLMNAHGTSHVTESVFDKRFKYVDELNRLNARINVEGNTACIQGPSDLTGAEVTATDLRAGAALIIGGLCAKGRTVINNIKHIDRGYEQIVEKLGTLGADIRRTE